MTRPEGPRHTEKCPRKRKESLQASQFTLPGKLHSRRTMARQPDDNNRSARYNKTTPARIEQPGSVGPQRRRTGNPGNPTPRPFPDRIWVAWIETEPMTTTQYHDAVDALAALIGRYWDDQPGASAA